MTEIERAPAATALVPLTGEVLDLTDPVQVARVRRELRDARGYIDEFNRTLDHVLLEESRRLGKKTIRLGDYTATIGPDSELSWDVTVLVELLAAGLPKERYDELVEEIVDYKVSAAVASQIEKANPEYAEIIGRARQRIPKRPTVKIGEA